MTEQQHSWDKPLPGLGAHAGASLYPANASKVQKKDQVANKISSLGFAYPAKRAYLVWEGEVLQVA